MIKAMIAIRVYVVQFIVRSSTSYICSTIPRCRLWLLIGRLCYLKGLNILQKVDRYRIVHVKTGRSLSSTMKVVQSFWGGRLANALSFSISAVVMLESFWRTSASGTWDVSSDACATSGMFNTIVTYRPSASTSFLVV
jgi:hypothetical protein